jgi:hypothetical protein
LVLGLRANLLIKTYPGRYTKEQAAEWAKQWVRDEASKAGSLTGAPAELPKSSQTVSVPPDQLLKGLNRLVGLGPVKADVRQLIDMAQVEQMRRRAGLPVSTFSRHLIFTGNPGTGKTTVARLLGQLYASIGILKTGQLIEASRSDLVAGYVGQTAIKTTEIVSRAIGGILFIDEAYSLARPGGGGRDFGQEAIDTLVKLMEDHRDELVVIVAGYEDEMKDFVGSNPGLPSRFPREVHFPDFTNEELVKIFENVCDYDKYVLSADAKQILLRHLESMTRTRTFGNGRLMRNIFEAALARQASRIVATKSSNLTELVPADLALPASMAATEGTKTEGNGGGGANGPSQAFDPEKQAGAYAYMLRAYAGETPECDAETAKFLAFMVRTLGRGKLQRESAITKEQADAAFLRWVRDEHASRKSQEAMGDAGAEGEGDSR